MKKPVPKKRNKLMVQFLAIVAAIVGGFLVIVFAASAITGVLTGGDKPTASGEPGISSGLDKDDNTDDNEDNNQEQFPRKTAILLAGLDEEAGLTDTLMAVCFDSVTKKVDVISIPRDTYISMDSGRLKEVRKRISNVGDSMKINSVYGYGGKEHNLEYLKAEIEELLGIEFNYHILVDLKAFRSIVDAVDGVEMTIRKQGFHYVDPTQNLVINVPGGRQVLNGKLAEGAVRFRDDYPGADLDRIHFQHEFMKAMFSKVLGDNGIKNKITELATIIISYVETDFTVGDALKYTQFIDDIDPENFSFTTLPGEPATIYPNGKKLSIYQHDEDEVKKLINDVFISTDLPEADGIPGLKLPLPTAKKIDLNKLNIQVLNGGNVSGLAGRKAEELTDDGLNVTDVANHSGDQKKVTKILVNDEEIINQHESAFDKYFKKTSMELDDTIPSKYDIVIIIGTDEK